MARTHPWTLALLCSAACSACAVAPGPPPPRGDASHAKDSSPVSVPPDAFSAESYLEQQPEAGGHEHMHHHGQHDSHSASPERADDAADGHADHKHGGAE